MSMKIAMVSEHASPLATVGGVDAGGQNVHVDALAAHLTALGHDVTVFTRRDAPGLLDRIVAPRGYAVEHVPAGPPTEIPKDELLPHMGDFASYLEARWSLERYDIVHTHFWMSGLAGVSAARCTGLPIVHTFHALGTVKRRHQGARDTSPPERIGIERRLCREVDHVIATCTDEVDELTAIGMAHAQASVVPCGVDLRTFTPDLEPRRKDGVRRGRARHRLLSIGRLVERKGVADVIAALGRLPDTELLIAGGPSPDALSVDPEVERLVGCAEAAGVTERVRFLGQVCREEVPALIRSCDVVVTVPWYEPFGIVPLEAMACGRPVVVSAVGGLTDTVVPGVAGEHVPPRDPKRLAVVLRRLLADKHRRAAFERAGLRRVRSRYGWRSVARSTESVYQRITNRADLDLHEEVRP
jgi:glycosyltransferase involved in cell wall biosynthesis